jgi:hypothetical protein
MLVTCRTCGKSFSETCEDCPHCGSFHHLETVCPNCGFTSVARRYNLCPRCWGILLEGRPIARWLLVEIPVTIMLGIGVYIQEDWNARAAMFVLMWLLTTGYITWSVIDGARWDRRNRKWTDRLESKRKRRAREDKSEHDSGHR